MKIALCLYGHAGINTFASTRTENDISKESEQASTNPSHAAHYYINYLFKRYDVDTFIHSWSVNQSKRLHQLYSPKKALIEPQIEFSQSLEPYGIVGADMDKWDISASARFGYELLLPSRKTTENIMTEMSREAYRTQSRWYSTKQSVLLKAEHEKQNNFKYDFVLLTRLDCIFGAPIVFEDLNPSKIYASARIGRLDIDHALHDFWFIANSEVMDQFGALYDSITDYCIRPTFACREHIRAINQEENLKAYLEHGRHYRKA